MMNRVFQDQIGNSLLIDALPQRIVSLVPSLTELLFDLDLEEEIIGVTRFCVHPFEKCHKKIKVGGTKDFDIDRIIQLKPILSLPARKKIPGKELKNYQHIFRYM